jgi:hypothetical protein
MAGLCDCTLARASAVQGVLAAAGSRTLSLGAVAAQRVARACITGATQGRFT